VILTDLLQFYPAAMKIIGVVGRQETGRWLNNRVENSHQPFTSTIQVAKVRDGEVQGRKSLQKFTSVHASVYSHFN